MMENERTKEQAIYSLTINKNVRETFPNAEVTYRIYLKLMKSHFINKGGSRILKLLGIINESIIYTKVSE